MAGKFFFLTSENEKKKKKNKIFLIYRVQTLENQFCKKSISPTKPTSSERVSIMDINTLMHTKTEMILL